MTSPILVSIVDDHHIVHLVTVLVPIFVSMAVAWFVYLQARTAREKLRLDLYNRRFAIYEKAIAFYREFPSSPRWNEGIPDEKQIRMITDLVIATRESRFLFDEKDMIFPEMQRLSKAILERIKDRYTDPEPILHSIEEKMAPYLNFHNIR